MRKLVSVLFLAATVGLAVPALGATTPEGANPPEADVPAPKKEKLVCVRQRELGSNLSTKVCQTEAQWQAERAHSQEKLRKPNN